MGKALNPVGFQVAAAIRTTDGAKVDLWMKGSGGGSDAAGLVEDALASVGVGGLGGALGGSDSASAELVGMDLPYVEAIDVELSLGLSARVAVIFACPFEIGLHLLGTSLFQVGNFIEVQIGYPHAGRFTPWISAIMGKPSIRISGDDGLTVTINGDGGGFAALRGVSSKVYSGKSYKDIIKDIADRHKLKTSFPGDTGFDLASVIGGAGLGGGDDPLEETRERISQENLSDWFFVQKIARAAGCDAFIAPDDDGKRTLFVKRRKDELKGSPNFKLLMRGQPDFNKIFPILSFDSEAEGVWLGGAAAETKTRDIDPDDGSVIEETASAESTDEASLGNAGVPGNAKTEIEGETSQLLSSSGTGRTGEHLTTSKRDPRGQKALAQTHRDETMIRGGINAIIGTYGIPELLPGSVVEVDGLGMFNANYYIEGLTWTANSSEFVSRLRVINNATADGMIDKHFLDDPASTNTEHVDGGNEADSGGNIIAEVVGL